VSDVVVGDGRGHEFDGGTKMGCGGVGDGGAPARFLGEALAWELREGSVKVVVRSIWRIGARGWEFHGELGLGGIHGGGKGVLQLRRGWGGNVRVCE
jgi:hypothetical protein